MAVVSGQKNAIMAMVKSNIPSMTIIHLFLTIGEPERANAIIAMPANKHIIPKMMMTVNSESSGEMNARKPHTIRIRPMINFAHQSLTRSPVITSLCTDA